VTPDVFAFWAFAALTLIGALLTILSRNAVHSAVWLIASLLGTAGLFLLQKAEFLFAVQIVLYVGGIMVLFLFVIMLVNLDQQAKERQFNGQWWLGTIAVALVAFEAAYFVWKGLPKLPPPAAPAAALEGNTERLADLLFTEYLVPFEVASLLLLAAVVGSVLMAKGRRA
jgi:NADH-quinone oxidoreductase subunit J